MLIVGVSQTEQGRECLSQWNKKARDGGEERKRRSVTVLCCGKQHPGGGELKTQTVFNGQLCPRGRTERPVACPTSLSAHRCFLQVLRGGQNQNICSK